MQSWRTLRLVFCLASLLGATGFATCGGDAPDTGRAEGESATEATIEEEREDMERDIDR
jgi:hypothetical protein